MPETPGCIFPMIGGDVTVDFVLDSHAHVAAFVVTIEGRDEVTIFAMPLEGVKHVKQHIDEAIEYLETIRGIAESN
jgi:hypothetical protein